MEQQLIAKMRRKVAGNGTTAATQRSKIVMLLPHLYFRTISVFLGEETHGVGGLVNLLCCAYVARFVIRVVTRVVVRQSFQEQS